MHAFDDGVGRHDDVLANCLQDRRIIAKAECAGVGGKRAKEARDQVRLDPLIDDALSRGWPLKRIDALLRAVLRAGAYELEHRKDVPGRVVVSEYVDVAHAFVEADETGMVNAVLDQIGRQFRADEFVRAGR